MELIISLPDNLIVEQMIEQKHIPCFCTVKNDFNIHFQHPLPEAIGKVNNWDRSMLEERVPVGVGCSSLVNIQFAWMVKFTPVTTLRI